MTEDLELRLRQGFRDRVGTSVDTTALLNAAMRKGHRRRGWTYAARGGAATAAVGVLTLLLPGHGPGTTTAGPGHASPSSWPSWSASGPSWSASGGSGWPGGTEPPLVDGQVPALPVAQGVAGAGQDPSVIAADPRYLHFTLDAAPARAAYLAWDVSDGAESVDINRADHTSYVVSLARDQAALDRVGDSPGTPKQDWSHAVTSATTVAGRPATFSVVGDKSRLRWQPVDGIFAQVYGSHQPEPVKEQDSVAIGAGLRLDRAYRCASPVHLASMPAGARLLSCRVVVDGYDRRDSTGQPTRVTMAAVTVGTGSTAYVDITLATAMPPPPDGTPDPGHSSALYGYDPSGNPTVVPGASLVSMFRNVSGYSVELSGTGYDLGALRAIGDGLTIHGDGRAPTTWPDRLVG